jgi:outer membrane protein TolC
LSGILGWFRSVKIEIAKSSALAHRLHDNFKEGLKKIAHQPGTSELYDAHFDASLEIDVFNSKRRSLEEASDDLAASQEDLHRSDLRIQKKQGAHDVLMSLLGDVARNYMEERGSQQRPAIASKNITAQSESIELTQHASKRVPPANWT